MKKQWRDEKLIKALAIRLKELRDKTGLSQEAVYEKTGVHIGKIETAQYNVTISTLSKLCSFYGITLEELLRGIEGA